MFSVLMKYLHEFSRINEVMLQHLLSETTHHAVKLICCLTVLDPPGKKQGTQEWRKGKP